MSLEIAWIVILETAKEMIETEASSDVVLGGLLALLEDVHPRRPSLNWARRVLLVLDCGQLRRG